MSQTIGSERYRDSRGSSDLVLILKTLGLLVVLLLVITAFGLGGIVLVDRVVMPTVTSLGSEVELPDIVDQEYYAARRTLQDLGLELEVIDEDFSPVIDEDHIIDQVPPPFTQVKKGRMVGVVVSRGPERIIVPNLVRLSEEQARARIRDAGMTVGRINERPDDSPRGTVIEQNPTAGVETLIKTPIELVVSTGPTAVTVPIPRLINMGLDQALQTIRDLKGRVWVEWVEDNSSLFLTVVGQTPQPGELVGITPIFDLRVALRSGAVPPPIDTTGIGAPPPWQRPARVLPPPGFVPPVPRP